jgi:hypothetical protein
MPNQLRARSRIGRLTLLDEEDKSSSPSYFEWREQTITTRAYQPAAKAQPRIRSLFRLFRRFA